MLPVIDFHALGHALMWAFLYTLGAGAILAVLFGRPSKVERQFRKRLKREQRALAKRAGQRPSVSRLGEARR